MITIPFCENWFLSLGTPGDATLIEVIYRNLNSHMIARQNADIIHAELSRDMSGHQVAVGKSHLEGGVGQCLFDHAFKFNNVVLRQKNPSLGLI